MATHLKGTIELIGKKEQSSLAYKLSPPEFSISDTLMNNFKKYGFSAEEKQILTQEYRKSILNLTNLEKEDLLEQARVLIRRSKRLKSDTVEVKASGEGAFICLVAIFSGELPTDKRFFFTLNSVPLKLLKREFFKKKAKPTSVNIDLRSSSECWLNSLKCLKQCPGYLDIHGDSEIDNWVEAA